MTDYDLWLVLDGQGRGQIGSARIELTPGTLLVLRPGDTGRFGHDRRRPLTVVYCHFGFVDPATRRWLDLDEQWLPSRHIRISDESLMGELLSRVVRLRRDSHPASALETSAALVTALVEVYRQDARADGHPLRTFDVRVQRVVEQVQYQPGLRLSLADAAYLAGLSQRYFSRLFTSNVGVSLREFVLETRLARAQHLLAETTMTVTAIARALGYDLTWLTIWAWVWRHAADLGFVGGRVWILRTSQGRSLRSWRMCAP